MTNEAFDQIMSDYVDELRDLLDAGLVDERTSVEFSSGERFITVSKRLWEMASARPQRVALRFQRKSNRDATFERLNERHEKERPQREARIAARSAAPNRS